MISFEALVNRYPALDWGKVSAVDFFGTVKQNTRYYLVIGIGSKYVYPSFYHQGGLLLQTSCRIAVASATQANLEQAVLSMLVREARLQLYSENAELARTLLRSLQ